MQLQFFKQSITWQEMHPFPLLYFQRQYFNRIYDHKSLSLLKSICNMTRWISLSGPRDIAWVVLYSRFVAPVTQRVQICWDSITHPCIIFGKMLSEFVPLLLEKYRELFNKKCSDHHYDYVGDLFFIHSPAHFWWDYN